MTTRTAKAKTTAKTFAADVQDKAKAAYAKGSAVAGEIGTMTKGNVEAVVASGKILGAGLKELGEGSVTEGKQAVNTWLADFKELTAVRTPQAFFDLQVKLAKRNVETALALTSKNSKALGKLATDAAAPISAQAKANVAKLRVAA